jgi:hypothetical protein
VANRNSTRGVVPGDVGGDAAPKAALTRLECALDGGLKLESRTWRVWTADDDEGGHVEGTDRKTRNVVVDEAANSFNAWEKCDRRPESACMSRAGEDIFSRVARPGAWFAGDGQGLND